MSHPSDLMFNQPQAQGKRLDRAIYIFEPWSQSSQRIRILLVRKYAVAFSLMVGLLLRVVGASKTGVGQMRRTYSPRFGSGGRFCPTLFQRERGVLSLKSELLRSGRDLPLSTNSFGMFSDFWRYPHAREFRTWHLHQFKSY